MATTCSRYPMPAPPYSSATVIPSTPSLPIFGHKSIGKSLDLSMLAARGLISSVANASTLSRSMSALSPRSKLMAGGRFIKMGGTGGFLWCSAALYVRPVRETTSLTGAAAPLRRKVMARNGKCHDQHQLRARRGGRAAARGDHRSEPRPHGRALRGQPGADRSQPGCPLDV